MPSKTSGRKSRNCGTQTGDGIAVTTSREKGIQVGTYPDLREKAEATKQREKMDMFPKIDKADKEVYLFMRGKKEFVQRLKNAFVRDKRVVANYGGIYLGMSEDIKIYEGDLYNHLPEQCVIIIQFRDSKHAERWTQSSNIFKQKDFPSPADEIEIFTVPCSYIPNEGLKAFQLTEMYGLMVSPEDFQKNYVNNVTKLMNSRRIYHGILASHQVQRLRNCRIRPDTYILLNGADCESKLKEFYDSADYRKYKEYRQKAVAETDSCFFTICPVTSS